MTKQENANPYVAQRPTVQCPDLAMLVCVSIGRCAPSVVHVLQAATMTLQQATTLCALLLLACIATADAGDSALDAIPAWKHQALAATRKLLEDPGPEVVFKMHTVVMDGAPEVLFSIDKTFVERRLTKDRAQDVLKMLNSLVRDGPPEFVFETIPVGEYTVPVISFAIKKQGRYEALFGQADKSNVPAATGG